MSSWFITATLLHWISNGNAAARPYNPYLADISGPDVRRKVKRLVLWSSDVLQYEQCWQSPMVANMADIDLPLLVYGDCPLTSLQYTVPMQP
jgi:hypothetical protein